MKYHVFPEVDKLYVSMDDLYFVNHKVSYPDQGYFLVDGKYLIEVGGPSKDNLQILGINNSYLALDDMEYPVGNKMPLWLFGFLY